MNDYTGHIPPQAIDIEAAVLGTLLMNAQTLDYASIHLNEKVFYKNVHQSIFRAVMDLHRDNKTVDMLTVTNHLKNTNKLDEVGGPYYITQLTDKILYVGLETHIAILKQKHARREAIRIGYELQRTGFDDSIDELEAFTVLDRQHKELSDLLFGNYAINTFGEVAQQSLKELHERIEKHLQGAAPGIATGLVDVDKVLAGWQPGDLVVIAGRPGMGKTAIALHFAKIAAKQAKHIYMFSLEMTNTRLADRIIVGETEVNPRSYKVGSIDSNDLETVTNWINANSGLPIYLDEKSFVNIDYIVSNARMRKRKNELDMLVVDYLQLIDMSVDRNGTKDQAIGVVTRKLKSLAKELNIPILLLSQLNRKVEERADKRPSLHDLRESGNIEQDADIVLFTYRPAYYDIEQFEGENTEGVMVVDVAKHRNGQANIHMVVKHNESLSNFYDNYSSAEPDYLKPF